MPKQSHANSEERVGRAQRNLGRPYDAHSPAVRPNGVSTAGGTDVGVSVAHAEDEPPHLRQLVQASSAAATDLAAHRAGLLPPEALLLHEGVDLVEVEPAEVQPLDLLAMHVEEDEVRVVVRDEVDLCFSGPGINQDGGRLFCET